jgi:hypothetical protein
VKALAILVALTATAAADARVDWARGLVIADGISVADRHAPSPAVARGTARRVAEDLAKKAIEGELGKLPLAAGGKVADKLDRARLDAVLARAFAIAAEPETDGGWNVTMAVPIEAVRQAIAGARALSASGDKGPAVVIVDGATAKPAVGWKIGGIDGAAIWPEQIPDWAKDAPHVKAKAAKAGAIEVEGTTATPSTLFVILRK